MKIDKFHIVISRCFIGLLFLPYFLHAQAIYTIPRLEKADRKAGSAVVKSIKNETQVIGDGFQLTLAKGWTLNPVGESNMFAASFNAHPTENIEGDPVYIGIHRQKTTLDLKKIKASQQSKGRKIIETNGPSYQTLQTEYLNAKINEGEEQVFVWYVKTKSADFVVLAGAPATDKKISRLFKPS